MEIDELRDFCDWENERRGIKKLGGSAYGGSEVRKDLEGRGFARAVIDMFLLATARGIDVAGVLEREVEELRSSGVRC
ncbi:MAG: hypothetical protein KJ592_04550 [Nanoarchaeota archaeon]|nr:hypothetical protein [Nanoarchaeota archaeon]